jgi:hypothetical protein
MTMHTHLTRQLVEEVMGRLDDLKLAEIMETGASPSELEEAKLWLQGYKRTVPDTLPLRANVVDRLCDIMRVDEPEWYDGANH